MSLLGTGTNMWRVKPVNGIPIQLSCISIRMMMSSLYLLDLIWIFIAPDSSLKYYTFLRIDISLYSETLSRFRANMLSLLLLLNTVYLAEKQQRLTRPGLEPTIYSTQRDHTNHYTTDAVAS